MFAALALVLALVGLYGLMSYGVSERTREIGVRMAVGARPRDVLHEVVGSGLKLVFAGLTIGVGLALVGMRSIASLLYGVPAIAPLSYAVISLALLVAGGAACYVPARRAATIDPMETLKVE